jgi:hypothetical protein
MATFFSDEINKLPVGLLCYSASSPLTPPDFSSFTAVSIDEVSKLLFQTANTNCDLDPIPTSLLTECSSVLIPTIIMRNN